MSEPGLPPREESASTAEPDAVPEPATFPEPAAFPELVEGRFDRLDDRMPLDDRVPLDDRAEGSLTDGNWHRMHKASPLLKGGIALIAIIGVLIANLREHLIRFFVPGYEEGGDPVDFILDEGLTGVALAALAVFLIVLVAGFYLSWRMHSFRITSEVVEVRSGILFRTNRKARLDRIQGINIERPFLARLIGAAKLEINQAGQGANVELSYLGSSASDELRQEILRLASGTRAAASPAAAPGRGAIDRRVSELLAPELDPGLAAPESVVKIGLGRLIGSILLSGTTIFFVGGVVATVIIVFVVREPAILFGFIPGMIGVGSFYVSQFTKSLRYSIAGTPDGVRVGFGLLSTSNETLPPGRVHSVAVTQPLLWRRFGWWQVKVNTAGQSMTSGAAGQANTTIMPVGDREDAVRVLGLLLPGLADDSLRHLIEDGMLGRGSEHDDFTNSPHRAARFRWFSWRRNGFIITPEATVLRKGAIWRRLIIVPNPRVQSVSVAQGPFYRRSRLARVHLHTVPGPVTASLGAMDEQVALQMFGSIAETAVRSATRDTSHRWRASESPA